MYLHNIIQKDHIKEFCLFGIRYYLSFIPLIWSALMSSFYIALRLAFSFISHLNSLFTKAKSFPLMTKCDNKIRNKCENQLIR